jgi:PAS domain-containing protein
MTQRLEHFFAELSSRNEELESILSSMTEALLVLDGQGKIRLVNAAARKIMPGEISWAGITGSCSGR